MAGTWRNYHMVGVLIDCHEPPVSVSAHIHHVTQVHRLSLIEPFFVRRDTRLAVAARSTHPFAGGTPHTFYCLFEPRECLFLHEAPHQIVVGRMSKIHVKTSQSRFDSRCQSQTVAWIQLGVVEGDSIVVRNMNTRMIFLVGLWIVRPGVKRKLLLVRDTHSLLFAFAQPVSQGPGCSSPPKSRRPPDHPEFHRPDGAPLRRDSGATALWS